MGASRFRRRIQILRSAAAGRPYLTDTGIAALQGGPEPDRIDRFVPEANDGLIGRGVSGWPYDGNALRLPHQDTPRGMVAVRAFARTIDTQTAAPSVYVGERLT
jgi:hypothetical protein